MMYTSQDANQPQPCILIVDDARINRELLRLNLQRHGYRFLQATNGREAMERVITDPDVDIILLDLLMPEMDGFDFLQWRQGNPKAEAIPVIVNSSLDDFDSIARALTMGSYDYFTKPLSKEDLETVLPLKIRNAVNARRLMSETQRQNGILRRELEMAARYQEFLLPDKVDLPELEVAFRFRPCTGVGGDYFDFVQLPDGCIAMMVADVSGHGVASAMTASIIKALLPGYLEHSHSPARALTELNDDLLRLTQEDAFVTAFAAIYHPAPRSLSWAKAGHPPSIFIPAAGEAVMLSENSFVLGSFDSSSPLVDYIDHKIDLKTGDRLLFFTDGLIEAPDPKGDQFGLDRLDSLVRETRRLDIKDMRKTIWDCVQKHVDGDFPDDVALIIVEF